MKKSIFKEGRTYTFKDYFDLSNPFDQIVTEFSYSYALGQIDLPELKTCNTDTINILKNVYYQFLPKINLNSETIT
ncbi:hypothetical protein QUF61_08150 [Candidatus Venteria ishoeyi]|uniref:hypothetical protein n=1 Tax=Candidatus Venteria ishoeyi TaxID=1899563 RepID=UPI0025A65B8B|nr:hypothetical protein [Candidatus Venteria ishoeyi]MDM8546453.1 hypothetical protein [Candidatus Venteria ishoeyi]